ncbi:PREDICTED: aldehyde oxidase GLOX1-like [Tarenaya hassleriana]|uniref:aldehyde oxidase GLOX1-like n=1 Tax=Tarenaya hassleriana TaxID=28532 RepID=UPI00053C350B|nr:PREDICTED: aldehyde oxidase GLOX1-like [Tarenaya hassleriana]
MGALTGLLWTISVAVLIAVAAAAEAETKWPGKWEMFVKNSGVSGMHAALMPNNKVLYYDSTIWRTSQIKLPKGVPCHVYDPKKPADCFAHSVLLDVNTGALRPLLLTTDTWCSSGGLTKNGTLISTGGYQGGGRTTRYLGTCDNCEWNEYPTALATKRWYSTQATLPDGSFVVFGGRETHNYEYIPREGRMNTKLFDLALLKETLEKDENNLYPFVWLNTDGNLFIFANDRAILLNPGTNAVLKEFPKIPGGARSFPGSGSSALLPIRLGVVNPDVIPAEVIICGGGNKEAMFRTNTRRIYEPALQDCGRIDINSPNPQWEIEMMPTRRIMGDAVILPTGDILFINGARRGAAGFNYAKDPNYIPLLYSPDRNISQRFTELARATIPRMYHSTAIALPDGKVLVGGSNTNDGYFYNVEFSTELRVEKFSPPYLDPALSNLRPTIVASGTPKQVRFRRKFTVKIELKQANVVKEDLKITMLAPSFTTHAVSMNMRMLVLGLNDVKSNVNPGVHHVQVYAPPNRNIAPPGYYLIFAVYRGVPSVGEWIQLV